jgi:hypothetical protein
MVRKELLLMNLLSICKILCLAGVNVNLCSVNACGSERTSLVALVWSLSEKKLHLQNHTDLRQVRPQKPNSQDARAKWLLMSKFTMFWQLKTG